MHAKCKLSVSKVFLCIALCLPLWSSCKDDYIYDNEEPDWLGANIYDYLQSRGEFQSYLALVNSFNTGEMPLPEVLRRTGSKTVFPANDEAYARYFASKGLTGDPVELIQNLPDSEKRYLFNSTMLNMAYLSNMLANVSSDALGLGEGLSLRREASTSYLDSIPYVAYNNMPKTSFWKFIEEKRGAYLADNGSRWLIYWTPQFMQTIGLTEADWGIVMRNPNGKPYDSEGFYVNDAHVKPENKDITCKNGYLHIADDVIVPASSMAEIINSTSEMSVFSNLMEKYAYPYYDQGVTDAANQYYEIYNRHFADSTIFTKRYMNEEDFQQDGEVKFRGYGLLVFDPGLNSYGGNQDMGVMFVPTDEAMQTYWDSPGGQFLRESYDSWDEVETDVLSSFIQNHQQRSFTSSLPHDWGIMTDIAGFEMPVKDENIIRSYVGGNGMVYLTNRVFPPADYEAVYGPAMTADTTDIIDRAIRNNDQSDPYNLKMHFYLRSLDNDYSLLAPTDDAMLNYRDPITWANWANGGGRPEDREIWSFYEYEGRVAAKVYGVKEDGTKGAYKYTLGETGYNAAVANRLQDILDMHIMSADSEREPLSSAFIDESEGHGLKYLLTKGGSILEVKGSGDQINVWGAGDKVNEFPAGEVITLDNGRRARYEMTNGHTFFIDRILQDPFKSVFTTMGEIEDYSAFFQLLVGNDDVFQYFEELDRGKPSESKLYKDIQPIFDTKETTSSIGIGSVVTAFNNFRYTILVPTAEALQEVFDPNSDSYDPNLHTWDEISAQNDIATKAKWTRYLLNFLKYHFIDGILPVSGAQYQNQSFPTAARYSSYDGTSLPNEGQFAYINVNTTGNTLTFETETTPSRTAKVQVDNENHNVFARDYEVNSPEIEDATQIVSSSKVVLHLVDHALNYQKK